MTRAQPALVEWRRTAAPRRLDRRKLPTEHASPYSSSAPAPGRRITAAGPIFELTICELEIGPNIPAALAGVSYKSKCPPPKTGNASAKRSPPALPAGECSNGET